MREPILPAILLALGASGCTWLDGADAGEGSSSCDFRVTCCAYAGSQPTPGDAGALPPDPGGPSPDGVTPVVLAISNLYYGDSDRNGLAGEYAWTQFGLNIDGKTTTGRSTDTCTLYEGASRCTIVDGESGIDNSFGMNILPIIVTTFGSSMSQRGNAALQAGDSTTLIRLDHLGSGADYSPLPGAVFHAAASATAPKWDGTDVRDVDVTSLVSGSLSSPALTLSGYMKGRRWVGTPPGGQMLLDLHLFTGNQPSPPLPISHVQVEMLVDPSNGAASGGVLSGIIAPGDIVEWAQLLAGSFTTSLCTGTAFQSIKEEILQASDIMMDGTNEPGQACNGISLGLGFDATAVTLGQAVSLPAMANPCADAGAEAGGDP
ncbi:MAG TPA: hypothetical protein VIF09_22040 [Polyangiaceae bacterium]|jgi:hypothetical protein